MRFYELNRKFGLRGIVEKPRQGDTDPIENTADSLVRMYLAVRSIERKYFILLLVSYDTSSPFSS